MGTEAANDEVVQRITGSAPYLVDVCRAGDVVPELEPGVFLHAGPPLQGWGSASELLRASVEGTLVVDGTAADLESARKFIDRSGVSLRAAQDFNVLATYAGVIGKDTQLLVVEDEIHGNRTYAGINEGRGKALRYGANDPETLRRLQWLEGKFANVLGRALRENSPIDLFQITQEALRMGDEGHSRQKAASSLLANALVLRLLGLEEERRDVQEVARVLVENDFFFLSLSMAGAKCALKAGERVPGASVVTCMGFNGVDFGIQVSGLDGEWLVAPAPEINGQFFEGYGSEDATTVIGDSEVAETIGLGAFAMAGAPALAPYIGGTPEDATRMANEMYGITWTEHPKFRIPAAGFRGTPLGIDVFRVVERDTTPIFSTGIAHKHPGIGQIGAGWGRTPIAPFVRAADSLGR